MYIYISMCVYAYASLSIYIPLRTVAKWFWFDPCVSFFSRNNYFIYLFVSYLHENRGSNDIFVMYCAMCFFLRNNYFIYLVVSYLSINRDAGTV